MSQIPDMQLVILSGSSEGDTRAIVDISRPLPLLKILREMPLVKSVVEQKNNIKVALKTEPAINIGLEATALIETTEVV